MNDNTTYYTDLLTRYFSGEITEDELHVLSDWLKADEQNAAFFRQYHKTWLLIEKQQVHSKTDVELEWNAILPKLIETSSEKPTPKVVQLAGVDTYKRSFFLSHWRAIAAVAVILISTFTLYFYLSGPSNIVVTAQNENIEQLLPDGSVVSLHAGSQLSYPEKFSATSRNVELHGEAYFKVAHNVKKPFIVSSGNAMVEVLGTQFNMNTKTPAGTMEVVLTTGKVSVYYKETPGENVFLAPGEKAELVVNQKHILKSVNSDPNYMAWKTRVLVFENESLAKVINTLQNVYQTPIHLTSQQLANCRVTASFNEQSLQSVLEVIKETLDLQVKENGKIIELSGTACQ